MKRMRHNLVKYGPKAVDVLDALANGGTLERSAQGRYVLCANPRDPEDARFVSEIIVAKMIQDNYLTASAWGRAYGEVQYALTKYGRHQWRLSQQTNGTDGDSLLSRQASS